MPTWTAPTTRSTGDLISASIWNTDLVENLKYFKDAPVFDTAVIIGAATTAGIRLDLESGVLAVREGDDSAYGPMRTGPLTVVGSTPAATPSWLSSDSMIVSGTNNNVLQLHAGAATGSQAFAFSVGTTRSKAGMGYDNGADYLFFTTNSTERIRLPSAGGVQCVTTLSIGNATPAATGAGITFPASQSASSDANTLDDYEEGTWTATLKGGTTDPTTPVTVTGNYTKIGRQVTITAVFLNVTTTGASGTVSVTGAPFSSSGISTGAAMCHTFDLNGGTGLTAYITGSVIEFFALVDDAAWVQLRHNAGTNRSLWFTITYFV